MKVIVAPSLALARSVHPAITIEAEYGSVVVEGSRFTAAHHQPEGPYSRFVSPAPCNNIHIPPIGEGEIILLSHVDLDSFGGALRAIAEHDIFTGHTASFWDLAEKVDLSGAHKVMTFGAGKEDIRALYAYWAWARQNVPCLRRDQISDVTETTLQVGDALERILGGDEKLLSKGDAFREAETDLNRRTFVKKVRGVIGRQSEGEFTNHLYTTPDGELCHAIVSWDQKGGAITVSLADPIPGVSCRQFVQDLWGPEAGGHDGIAGSPRGRRMTGVDWHHAIIRFSDLLGEME